MFTGVFKIFRMFRQTVAGSDTPRQIGCGIAIGMMIGLIPKDSLFVFALGIILLISTANLFSALVSGFIFSWIGFLVDPWSHSVGHWVLTQPTLQETWLKLYETPVVPWTRFENTVVTGSLIIGLVLFYPTYRISCKTLNIFGPRIDRKLNRFIVYRWLSGAERIIEDAPSENVSPATEVSL